MADTALIVPVPRVAPWVEPWSSRYAPSAAGGVPPHVTVLFPFLPPEELTSPVIESLELVAGDMPAFTTRFDQIGVFGDGEVLHLRPDRDEPFRQLTSAVRTRWPALQPYEGRVADPVPHLTVGFDIPRAWARHATRSLECAMPISVRVDVCQLWVADDDQWTHLHSFPLAR